MEIEKALESFGLTKNEVEVYTKLLSLGPSKVQDVVKQLKLPRTTVYNTLNLLKNKGLVSFTIQNNVQTFESVDPEKFLELLEEKQNSIELVIPQLLQLKKTLKNKPDVEVYIGLEGLKTIMNDSIKEKNSEIFAIGGSGKSRVEILPTFVAIWHQKRQKNNVKINLIYHDTKLARDRVDKYQEDFKLSEVRFLSSNFVSPIVTFIYKNKISLASWSSNPFGIIIKDEEIAKNYLEHFKTIWKNSKK